MNVRFLPGAAIAFALLPLPLVTSFVSQAKADEDSLYSVSEALALRYGSSFPRGFESLGEKRVFHHRRIRSMKKDLNDYSSNLHDLRRRFQKIFYGRDDGGYGAAPFVVGEEPSLSSVVPDPNRVAYFPPAPNPPRPEPYPVISLDPPEPVVNEEDQLAFTVDGPGQYPRMSEESIPVVERGSRFDYYLFPRVGYSHPAKKHVFPDVGKEYKVGYSIALSAGVRRGPWTLGIDVSRRHNDLKHRSYVIHPYPGGSTYTVQDGENNSLAILLRGSYALPLSSRLALVLSSGIGVARYKVTSTVTKGISAVSLPPEPDWSFAGTVGGSLKWVLAENMAAHLGLHYYHEKEVPSYNADLGLELDF